MRYTKRASIVFLVILLVFLFFIFKPSYTYKMDSRPEERLTVFVLDGADWRIINSLLEQGRLKNFEWLIANGASGYSTSVMPIYTPVNMASLFSGKSPDKHGIRSHFFADGSNTKNQLYRNMKVKPLWEILRNKNISVDLIGFQEFDYAPKIEGTIVSGLYLIKNVAENNDYFGKKEELGYLRYLPDKLLVSDDKGPILKDYKFLGQSEEMMQKRGLSTDFSSAVTNSMQTYIISSLKKTELIKKHNFEFSKLVEGLDAFFESNESAKLIFDYDLLSKEIAFDLYKRKKSDIMFVYFSGTDVFSHNYYMEGWHINDTSGAQEQIYKYYEIMDEYIGEFLKASGSNERFLVISDHGTQNTTLDEYMNSPNHEEPHTIRGIFIAYGPNIKKAYRMENVSIMDITPTILNLYNQPIAEDFDGKILYELFDEEYTKNKTANTIDTYEE